MAPVVPGVTEVFHARFTEYAYPMHVHDAWTLLIVDDGAVRYDLGRHEHGTPHDTVTLLPPHVPHNGSPATPGVSASGSCISTPARGGADRSGRGLPDLRDPVLRVRVARLHSALARPGDELEAESRLTLVAERLRRHLRPRAGAPRRFRDPVLARRCGSCWTPGSLPVSRWRRPRGRCTPIRRIWYGRSAGRTASRRTST
ncbi:AraC family ligand binding domain-containing protein [Streptomyces nogalater]